MRIRLIAFAVLLTLSWCSCGTEKNICTYQVDLFRTSQSYDFFYLKIDSVFEYKDSLGLQSQKPLAYFLTKYCTNNDTINFYLKINDRDTTFKMKTTLSDSLLLGMGNNRFIVFKKGEYIWQLD